MPVYEDAWASGSGSELGIEAATAPGTEAGGITAPLLPEAETPESVFEKTLGTKVSTQSPDRGPAMHADRSKADQITNLARSFIGTSYKWGGTSPSGFDCSGLLYYVFGKFGVKLPRVSFQQARAGTAVSAKSAQAGDIVWFDNSARNDGADHVGLYLGGGMMLEAPRPGVPVRIRRLSPDEGAGFTRVL